MTLPWAPALPLLTERLVLRGHESRDLDDLLVFHTDAEVVRYIPWPVRTRAEVETALATKLRQHVVVVPGKALVLAIEFEGTVIGEILLKHVDGEPEVRAELGYVLNPRYQGNGFATEAARTMLGLAFGELGVHRVTAILDERNTASARLLERVGMTLSRSYEADFKGELVTELEYEISR